MADPVQLTGNATVGQDGRVLIPAEFRRKMGLRPGDRVQLLLSDDALSITSARAMSRAVWANNLGDTSADDAVRTAREADAQAAAAKWRRVDDAGESTGDLLGVLGLA